MKKLLTISLFALLTLSTTSCATVFGGKVSECQRTRPKAGEPARQVRVGALIANILLFWPGVIIDFATSAAYRPCDK